MIKDKIMLPDTIQYYPDHLRRMPEFRALAECFDRMLLSVYGALYKQEADSMFLTLTESGCEIYERLLKLRTAPADSLETRRARIIAAQFMQPPYTEKRLREALDSLCGPDNYDLDVDRENCLVKIRVRAQTEEGRAALMSEAGRILEKWLPMNLGYGLSAFEYYHMPAAQYCGVAVTMTRKYYVTVLEEGV